MSSEYPVPASDDMTFYDLISRFPKRRYGKSSTSISLAAGLARKGKRVSSVVQISKTIGEVKEFFNPRLELAGFLFTMRDQTINTETSLRILRQTYTGQMPNTITPATSISVTLI